MPKGRIGLSLEQDVLDILTKYGRSELGCRGCEVTPQPDICPRCGNKPGEKRPTRTEIVEEAVRAWAMLGGGEMGGLLAQSNGTPDARSTARLDDHTNSLSSESKQAREVKKAARRERKAKLQESVKEAWPLGAERDAKQVVPDTPQTYCPFHRPKWCEPGCKHRVAV